jgi:tetratricopeptide (TPR) repeat protein
VKAKSKMKPMVTALTAFVLLAAAPGAFGPVEKQIAAGDYRAALTALEMSAPDDRRAQWHLLASQCHDGLNDPASAVREAQEAIDLDPRNEPARIQLAQIFLTRNTPEAAYEILSEALPLFPQSALIRLGLGLALNGLQRYEEAIRVLRDSLRLKPDLGLAFDGLGNAYIDSTDFEGLLQEAEEYVRRNPADFRGHYYQATARRELGKSAEETEALVRRSLELNPRFAAAQVLLGRLLLDSDRTDEAARVLEQAVRLRPNYAPAHLYLATAYRRLGRTDLAREQSEEVSKINNQQNEPIPHLLYHRGNRSANPSSSDQK